MVDVVLHPPCPCGAVLCGQPDSRVLGVPLHRFVISTFLGIIPERWCSRLSGQALGEVFAAVKRPILA